MSLRAPWKMVPDEVDNVSTVSYGQELLRYVTPQDGCNKRHHRKGVEFGPFLEKAIQLKVDLKSCSH